MVQIRHLLIACVVACGAGGALAQGPAVPQAAPMPKRYPQPIRVGSIIGQDLLQPVEAQPVLGHIQAVRQGPDGAVTVIVMLGSILGTGLSTGGRTVALPSDMVAYLGPQLALTGYTPEQLRNLAAAPDGPDLPPDAVVPLPITKPFH